MFVQINWIVKQKGKRMIREKRRQLCVFVEYLVWVGDWFGVEGAQKMKIVSWMWKDVDKQTSGHHFRHRSVLWTRAEHDEKAEGSVNGVRLGGSKRSFWEVGPWVALCTLGVEEHFRERNHQVQTPGGGMHAHSGSRRRFPLFSLVLVCLQKQSVYFPMGLRVARKMLLSKTDT